MPSGSLRTAPESTERARFPSVVTCFEGDPEVLLAIHRVLNCCDNSQWYTTNTRSSDGLGA